MSDDPYVYPGTDVLRNSLGIRDGAELRRVEAQLTRVRMQLLTLGQPPDRYDLPQLCEFHRKLFEDLYDWAGELRRVSISKPGAIFALPAHIERYATNVFDRLQRERYLLGLERERFFDRLAHYLAEVNALHPFRDGNGRTQRLFFSHLATEAGWHLAWDRVTPERNIAASLAALHGDEAPLRNLLVDASEPLQRTAQLPSRPRSKRDAPDLDLF